MCVSLGFSSAHAQVGKYSLRVLPDPLGAITNVNVLVGQANDGQLYAEVYKLENSRAVSYLAKFDGLHWQYTDKVGAEGVSIAGINRAGVAAGATRGPSPVKPIAISALKASFLGSQRVYQGFGLAINDAGLIVGMATLAPDAPRKPAIYSAGAEELLDMPSEEGEAFDVNNAGQIVGYWFDTHGDFVPAVWIDRKPQRLNLEFGGKQLGGWASDISDSGYIAGVTGFTLTPMPFVTRNGQTTYYDALGRNSAFLGDLDEDGAAIGVVFNIPFQVTDPRLEQYVYLRDGHTFLADQLLAPEFENWQITQLHKFGLHGSILATAYDNSKPDSPNRMVILTPVPEPGSLAALGLGILAARRRRHP